MATNTINQIKDLRDQIRENQKTIDKSVYESKYGPESEYTGKGIYLGLDSLLNDISYLIKAHAQFIKLSTHSERSNIISILSSINAYLNDPVNLAAYIDQLKVQLRIYQVDRSKERWELFQEVNKSLLEQRDEFSQTIDKVKQIESEISESKSTVDLKIDEFDKKFTELQTTIDEVETKNKEIQGNAEILKGVNEELEEILVEAKEKLIEVTSSLTAVKANEKLIDSFALKVQDREKRLAELEQLTEVNTGKLADYESERVKIIAEADKLIEDAKTALNYSTAKGLSASFDSQHREAKGWKFTISWILGAAACICIAIGLGVWIAWEKTNDLHLIIGRIAIIPLPIIAAVFCANQYVKQKTIIEDYAYKMVLAKSIVGFSEQLKKDSSEDKGEYVHYMKVALEEIHKDPLRRRNEDNYKNKAVEKIESLAIKDVLELLKLTKGM